MNSSSMHFFFKFDRPILDFEKIEFQNMGISLFNLKKGAKRWFFFAWKGHLPILAPKNEEWNKTMEKIVLTYLEDYEVGLANYIALNTT